MDFLQLAEKRRSVRQYSSREIPPETLRKILEAGRLAPSAMNAQPWRFIVVRTPERKEKLAEASRHDFVAQADVVIVGCVQDSPATLGPRFDVAIAMDHMSLAAFEEGVGNCWIGGFDRDKVRDLLDIPPEVDVTVMMSFGYPADEDRGTDRVPLEEIICYEEWRFGSGSSES